MVCLFPTQETMFPFLDMHYTINMSYIFQIRFGFKMTEESEISHWNQVLQNPGKEYTSWHVIMEQ